MAFFAIFMPHWYWCSLLLQIKTQCRKTKHNTSIELHGIRNYFFCISLNVRPSKKMFQVPIVGLNEIFIFCSLQNVWCIVFTVTNINKIFLGYQLCQFVKELVMFQGSSLSPSSGIWCNWIPWISPMYSHQNLCPWLGLCIWPLVLPVCLTYALPHLQGIRYILGNCRPNLFLADLSVWIFPSAQNVDGLDTAFSK